MSQDREHPLSKDEVWLEAVEKVLGEEALNLDELAEKKKRALGSENLPMGLGDFFLMKTAPCIRTPIPNAKPPLLDSAHGTHF